MLESYKVDARGNIQFQNGKSEGHRAFKTLPLVEPLSHHSVNGMRVKNPKVINQIEERRKQIIKDVQQMTLYQGADLTPDTEGGPRRMYQKTEIQEGDKRIEILEIVECVDTTPDSSPVKKQYKTPHSIRTPRLTPRSNRSSRLLAASTPKDNKELKLSSKIPVSYKSGKPNQQLSRSASRESSPNLSSANGANSNKEKAIANLLMQALNNNEGSTVEFVPSPKDYLKLPLVKRSGNRNGNRRSAHSGKYLTQFEVIPEERSGLSLDSSAEDTRPSSQSLHGIKQTHCPRTQLSNNLSEVSESSSLSPKSPKPTTSLLFVEQEVPKPVASSSSSESSKRSSPHSIKKAQRTDSNLPDSNSKSILEQSENSQNSLEQNINNRNKTEPAENIQHISEQNFGSESKSETSSVKNVKHLKPNQISSNSQSQSFNHSVTSRQNANNNSKSQKLVNSSINSQLNEADSSLANDVYHDNFNVTKTKRSPFQLMDKSNLDATNGNTSAIAESSTNTINKKNKNNKHPSPPPSQRRSAVVKEEHPSNTKGWSELSRQHLSSPNDISNEGICRHQLICVNL